jgi:acetyl-CoA synthetase
MSTGTADIGWVSGHSYVIRAARERRDGADTKARPTGPDKDRFWSLIERHGVTILHGPDRHSRHS